MRVGIFFGGSSSEREISFESGRHIYNSIDLERYEAIPIFVDQSLKFWKVTEHLLWMNTTADVIKNLDTDAGQIAYEDLPQHIDFAFLVTHGKYMEDGAMQGLLDLIDLPYNGPRVLGAAIGMDKIFQKHLLAAAGVQFAEHLVVTLSAYTESPLETEKAISDQIGFPCIIKPSREGCSTGVHRVDAPDQLSVAIQDALQWDNTVMAEVFMTGMEVTCTIIGNESPVALTPTETPSKNAVLTVEEKFLPGDAQMITPPRVPQEEVLLMQAEFVKAYQALQLCVYTRIDGFWDQETKTLYVNEPNTLPGVTPSTHVFHQAAHAGMDATAFINKLIELSLEMQELTKSSAYAEIATAQI